MPERHNRRKIKPLSSNNEGPSSLDPRREPFGTPQSDNFYFRNGYDGNFTNQMVLDRWAVERFCGIVGFESPIFLSTMPQTRTTSYESMGDTLARKDSLTNPLNTNPQSENPLLKVTSVPQGWNIAINDHELTRKVAEKKSDKPIADRYITDFNTLLRIGLTEAARRELITGERHPEFRAAALMTLYTTAAPIAILGEHFKDLPSIVEYTGIAGFFVVGAYGIANLAGSYHETKSGSRLVTMRRMQEPERVLKECLRPPVPVDNLLASNIFMKTRGRTLVRKKSIPQ